KVRAHEMAHLAAGGQFASGPSSEFEKGPDGGLYAVAGEGSIDTSPIPGDPEGTIAKANQIRAAALAPGDPSAQDRSVANAAAQMAAKAGAQ
ncbi:putative metalloprotease CJM1_0395 family protein, partial [Acinetobacter baumannii]